MLPSPNPVGNMLFQWLPHFPTCRLVTELFVESKRLFIELPDIQLNVTHLFVQRPSMCRLHERSTNSMPTKSLPHHEIVDDSIPSWHHDGNVRGLWYENVDEAHNVILAFGDEQSGILVRHDTGKMDFSPSISCGLLKQVGESLAVKNVYLLESFERSLAVLLGRLSS